MGFAAMLANESILIFLFAISSGSGGRNSIQLLSLTSTSVILLGYCTGLTEHGIPAQQQAPNVACNINETSSSKYILSDATFLLHFGE
jgi:hypothetical protein